MKTIKYVRAFCLLLSICLALTVMSGCGGNDGTPMSGVDQDRTVDSFEPDSTADLPGIFDPALAPNASGVQNSVEDKATETQASIDELLTQASAGDDAIQSSSDTLIAMPENPTPVDLLRNCFPLGKTVHATMAVNMSGELAIDLSALAEAFGEDSENITEDHQLELSSELTEDTGFYIYMNMQVDQGRDTMYMDGTVTSYMFGENDSASQKGYVTVNDDGTQDSYTYDEELQKWTVSHADGARTFGLEPLIDLTKLGEDDLQNFELELVGEEYILTGTANATNLFDVLVGSTGTGDIGATLGVTEGDVKTTVTMRFSRSTGELKSIVIGMEPVNVLFFNLTSVNLALANISFSDQNIEVPSDIRSSAEVLF